MMRTCRHLPPDWRPRCLPAVGRCSSKPRCCHVWSSGPPPAPGRTAGCRWGKGGLRRAPGTHLRRTQGSTFMVEGLELTLTRVIVSLLFLTHVLSSHPRLDFSFFLLLFFTGWRGSTKPSTARGDVLPLQCKSPSVQCYDKSLFKAVKGQVSCFLFPVFAFGFTLTEQKIKLVFIFHLKMSINSITKNRKQLCRDATPSNCPWGAKVS